MRAETLEDLWSGMDAGRPLWWCSPADGYFFVISCGRWREFGYCCGRMRWDWRYARWLMVEVKKALNAVKAQDA